MPRLRVLLVDDTDSIRMLLRSLLEGVCDVVGEATQGRQALRLTEELRPDLVVMDFQMPIMGGVEATREIKARWPEVDIVGYTSVPESEGAEEMAAAGASESFDKLNLELLLEAIKRRADAMGS